MFFFSAPALYCFGPVCVCYCYGPVSVCVSLRNSKLLKACLQGFQVVVSSFFDAGKQTQFLVNDDQCGGRPGRIYEACTVIGDLIHRYPDNTAQIKREVTEYCLRLQSKAEAPGAELEAPASVAAPTSPVVDSAAGGDFAPAWDHAASFFTILRWTADWRAVREALQRHMQKVTGPLGRALSEEDWHWYGPR
jgi:hypothetical protein